MTRHIADQPRTATGARTKRFVEIARRGEDDVPGRVWKSLHAQPAGRGTAARLRAFLNIDRGRSA